MNKTNWIIAFIGIIAIYCLGFGIGDALLVHGAFALALALGLITLSEV